jgi:hypothetical protein
LRLVISGLSLRTSRAPTICPILAPCNPLLVCRENYSKTFKRSFIKALDWAKATFRGEEYVESADGGKDHEEDDGDDDDEQSDVQATGRSEMVADVEEKRERSEVDADMEKKRERTEVDADVEEKRERSELDAESREFGKRAKLDEGTSDTQAPESDADQHEEDAQTSALKSEAQHYRPLFYHKYLPFQC